MLMEVALDDVGEIESVSGVCGRSPSCFCNSSLSISGSSTRCDNSMVCAISMDSTGRSSCACSSGGCDVLMRGLRSAWVDRRRPTKGRMTPEETGTGIDAWLLDGPNESRLRNERNEVRPPAAPAAGAFCPEVGAGVPLTAR